MAIPDWLTRLNAQGGQAYTDPNGMQYVPLQTNGATGPVDGYASIAANTPNLGGFGFNDFNTYDGQGNGTGTKSLGYTDDAFTKYAPYIIAALATMGVGSTIAGAGGAAAGTGAGAATGAGDAYMPGALGAGGNEVAFGSTIPGLESYALPAAAGGAAGGAAGASGGAGGGLGGGATTGMGSLLGPAATVLGGLLGSKPTTTGTSSTRNLPDYLQPSVTGLLAQTDALRNKFMTPGAMQGYDDMRTTGQGLINAPIAGNGVGKVPYPTNFGFRG